MAKQLISHSLGFEKLSKYEREHLHEANMQSSAYMGAIGVLMEIWMIARQTVTRIIPAYQGGGNLFELLFTYTSRYILILLFGLGLMIFCVSAPKKELTKGRFIAMLASGSVCMLYSFCLFKETFMTESDTVTTAMAGIVNFLIVAVYIILFLFGVTIVTYTLIRHTKKKAIVLLEHIVIILYTLVALAFGILVSYTDFWSGKNITCFLMMMIYVGCLLIYRPYITIILISVCTIGFYNILMTFQGGLSFKPKEYEFFGSTHLVTSGDTVNYIMFFISLTTMCIAMYHARLKEARKTYGLQLATVELERKNKESHEQFVQTTEALASAIDAKDKYTNGHSRRVAEYSANIAKTAGKPEEECERVYFAALLHDVGKIAVPIDILTKKGRLSNEEFARIKEHPGVGGGILANISQSPWLSEGARYHHERYDGKGYPEGLSENAIPEIGRIIAVADAYDAMTSNRSYRSAIPQHIVREELIKGSGSQFDPEFARIMIQMIDHDIDYAMQEGKAGEIGSQPKGLRCESIYHDCSEGCLVKDQMVRIRLNSQPDQGYPEEECLPTLIAFDSLDGNVHPGEENNRDLMYYEYARIRLDGQVTERNVRKSEVRISEQKSDIEHVWPETGQLYRIEAIRRKDHAIIRIVNNKKIKEVILALPDNSRFMYLAVTGEHCEIYDILMQTDEVVSTEEIPRIAEEISYIKGCPEGDLRNIEIDGWRADATEGVPVTDGMKISFHAMSLPIARMVWHCPFISLFSSENGMVDGPGFCEHILLRLDGESWESDDHVENKINVVPDASFAGWDNWKEKMRLGIDCSVTIGREGNRITMQTKNLGVSVSSVTNIMGETSEVYLALTGDQCAITDIHISR